MLPLVPLQWVNREVFTRASFLRSRLKKTSFAQSLSAVLYEYLKFSRIAKNYPHEVD